MCMDKPKIDEKYINTRLLGGNLNHYLEDNYGIVRLKEYRELPFVKAFLQKDYGGNGDCTLTSILTIVEFYRPELDSNEVYDYIEKIAKKYLYTETWGTFPGFNKAIVKEVFSHFNINKKVFSKYIKNIGFNENTIIEQIKSYIPIIISITRDGRKYYESHTITIIGYNKYEDKDGKQIIMLRVYDN